MGKEEASRNADKNPEVPETHMGFMSVCDQKESGHGDDVLRDVAEVEWRVFSEDGVGIYEGRSMCAGEDDDENGQ